MKVVQGKVLPVLFSLMLIVAGTLHADDSGSGKSPRSAAGAGRAGSTGTVYTPPPPSNPKPLVKVTVGAPRGSQLDIQLSLYVPADGRLPKDNPVIGWEASKGIEKPVRLIVTSQQQTRPLFDQIISRRVEAGIHEIRLADLGVALQSGEHYGCSVCISLDGSCSIARNLVVTTEFVIAGD